MTAFASMTSRISRPPLAIVAANRRSAGDGDFLPAGAIVIHGVGPAEGGPFIPRLLSVHDDMVQLGFIPFAVIMGQGNSANRKRKLWRSVGNGKQRASMV
jgi:hypothetical protein